MTSQSVQPDDEGSVLILALAFLTFFGLVLGGVLGLVQANLKTTDVVRARAVADYIGAAAVDGAVNSARSQPSVGARAADQTCFTLPAGTVNSNPQVDVRCTALPGSGAIVAGVVQPRDAVFTATAGGVLFLRSEVRFTDASGSADGSVPHVVTWSQQTP